MATEAATTQPWHVPEPSPWPIVGTAAALSLAFGLIWFMHAGVPWLVFDRRHIAGNNYGRLV